MLTIDVLGTPVPQGSMRGFQHKTTGRVIVTADNTKTKPWRQDITAAAMKALDGRPPMLGPVEVTVIFYLPRLKSHYRTGTHANKLKPGAPAFSSTKPDIDKLQRSCLDALTIAGVWRDDSQVAQITCAKEYADAATGARITVAPITITARPEPAEPDTEQGALL